LSVFNLTGDKTPSLFYNLRFREDLLNEVLLICQNFTDPSNLLDPVKGEF